jgi:hypothetical protein
MPRHAVSFALIAFAGILALAAVGPMPAYAGCGCDYCPVDAGSNWHEAKFTFDITQQYIDQDQPRAGTDDVAVGAIPAEHDEVRTVNRATTGVVAYRPSGSWTLAAALPYVDRYHEHIHNHAGGQERQIWNYSGVGDLEAMVTHFVEPKTGNTRYFVRAGMKAPTGKTQVETVDGDQPEPTARPGTGSWDYFGALGFEWRVAAPARADRQMPLRFSVTGRLNGKGTDDYEAGDEVLANFATLYPVSGPVDFMFQANFRVRGKDDVGNTIEDPDNTGGSTAYLSPGLSFNLGEGTSIYGLYQIPVYQDMNGIQLVSEGNIYAGISRGVF